MQIVRLITNPDEVRADIISKYDRVVIGIRNMKMLSKLFVENYLLGEFSFEHIKTSGGIFNGVPYVVCRREGE